MVQRSVSSNPVTYLRIPVNTEGYGVHEASATAVSSWERRVQQIVYSPQRFDGGWVAVTVLHAPEAADPQQLRRHLRAVHFIANAKELLMRKAQAVDLEGREEKQD